MEWGLRGLCLRGPLRALPFRAFFCSFSVSEDFFLISCRARLYSVRGGVREAAGTGDAAGVRGSPGPRAGPTFRVILVQLVG